MYNEQIKRAFIQKYTKSDKTKRLLLHIFGGTQEIEEKYGTDFYAMNTEQAQEAFTLVTGIRVSGASAILMILKAYVRWCNANGYRVSDAVYELRIDVYDKLKDGYVSSPRHLRETLDAVFPNPALNQIEYIYRSFFWLGFMGLQVSEAIQVTEGDLDFRGMRLLFFEKRDKANKDRNQDKTQTKDKPEEKLLPIYPESLADLRMAVELVELREERGAKGVWKQRAAGHEILRGKVSKLTLEEAVNTTFRPTISRAFKAAQDKREQDSSSIPRGASLQLTFKHAYMSGIFYRAYKEEQMGIPPSFDEIILMERRNAKVFKPSPNYTERKLLNILIRDMEQDYEHWKSVFG